MFKKFDSFNIQFDSVNSSLPNIRRDAQRTFQDRRQSSSYVEILNAFKT